LSGVFALGIEIMYWIIKAKQDGFEIKAEKKRGLRL